MQPQRPNSYMAATTTFNIGDKASYFVHQETPEGDRIYINEGVIVNLENELATVKLADGKEESVFLRKLSPAGETHVLSKALSRRDERRGRRMP